MESWSQIVYDRLNDAGGTQVPPTDPPSSRE
jgi:hypothetical protein